VERYIPQLVNSKCPRILFHSESRKVIPNITAFSPLFIDFFHIPFVRLQIGSKRLYPTKREKGEENMGN
jgi:hypothetical protein